MGGIFINYRRGGGHCDVVSSLGRRLAVYFGDDQIFLDVESIPLSAQWRNVLERRLLDAEVVLAVIHPQWLTECNANGSRRIDEQGDWVRHELELAIRSGKKIIPILLDDAPVPRVGELPESIRDVLEWQAHRIRADSRGADIEKLISQVELDVAPTWQPSDAIATTPPRQPGQWLVVLIAVLTLLMLVVPSVLALNAAPPTPGEVPVSLQLAGWSLLLMCAPFVAAAFVGVFRFMINTAERDLHGVSTSRYNTRVAMPLTAVTLASPLVICVFLGSGTGILISALIASLGFIYAARKMIRNENNEDELRRNWSYRLPTLLRPAVLRQGVALLDGQLKGWSRPLSKEQRERALWMLETLEQGAERIRKSAEQKRWRWMADRPWWITAYTLWVAITVGLATAAALPLLRVGHTSWQLWLLPVFTLLISGALSWGTMDFVYRRHRWQARAVAAEVTDNIRRLRRDLDNLAAPHKVDVGEETGLR